MERGEGGPKKSLKKKKRKKKKKGRDCFSPHPNQGKKKIIPAQAETEGKKNTEEDCQAKREKGGGGDGVLREWGKGVEESPVANLDLPALPMFSLKGGKEKKELLPAERKKEGCPRSPLGVPMIERWEKGEISSEKSKREGRKKRREEIFCPKETEQKKEKEGHRMVRNALPFAKKGRRGGGAKTLGGGRKKG